MRLDFKILWFDNQPDDVRTQIEEIKDYLVEVGFVPHIVIEHDGTNVKELGEQQEFFDEFDLVVVDYDLGQPDQNGDWVAKQIRRHFGFTDIIFYSGKRPDQLRELVFQGGIDGVYCFNRPALAEKLNGHIDQVMRRLSRLEAMRGLAMGVVGRCDDELKSLLLKAFAVAAPEQQASLDDKLTKIVSDSRESGMRKFETCGNFEERMQSRSVTSFTLYKLALFLLKGDERCSAKRELLVEYDAKVLEPRNRLAHAIERRTETGWAVEASGKDPITTAEFPKLRKDLAAHLDNICQITSIVSTRENDVASE